MDELFDILFSSEEGKALYQALCQTWTAAGGDGLPPDIWLVKMLKVVYRHYDGPPAEEQEMDSERAYQALQAAKDEFHDLALTLYFYTRHEGPMYLRLLQRAMDYLLFQEFAADTWQELRHKRDREVA